MHKVTLAGKMNDCTATRKRSNLSQKANHAVSSIAEFLLLSYADSFRIVDRLEASGNQ